MKTLWEVRFYVEFRKLEKMYNLIKLFKISKNINIQKKKGVYRFVNLETKDAIDLKINNSFSLFIIKDYLI